MDRGYTDLLSISRDGSKVVTVTDDFTRVWNSATGMPLTEGLGHAMLVAAFSPDGKRILLDGLEGEAGVWDLGSGKRVQSFGQDYGFCDGAFSPDGKTLATGYRYGPGGYTLIWKVEPDRRN